MKTTRLRSNHIKRKNKYRFKLYDQKYFEAAKEYREMLLRSYLIRQQLYDYASRCDRETFLSCGQVKLMKQ